MMRSEQRELPGVMVQGELERAAGSFICTVSLWGYRVSWDAESPRKTLDKTSLIWYSDGS